MTFDLTPYHIALAGIGAAIILAFWLPRFVGGREPTASALLVVLGAAVLGLVPGMPAVFNPVTNAPEWSVVAEIAVIVALFGTGLRIDNIASFARWTPALRLVLIAMPLTIAAIAGLGLWAGLPLATAVLLGAAFAPTDPVLAGDLQVGPPREGGEHPLRFALTTEAGLNDGLAFPFVYAAILLAAGTLDWGAWAGFYVVWKILVGLGCGAAAGWLLGKGFFTVPHGHTLADANAGVVALAAILATYGLTELAEGYGFLAVFVMGLLLRREEAEHSFHTSLHSFSETIEHALTAMLLVAIGASLPQLWPWLDWRIAVLIALSLIVVRPVVAWLSLAGGTLGGTHRAAVSFYGVRGIGTVFYVAYAASEASFGSIERLWAAVAFGIFASTIIHGLTAGWVMQRITGEDG
ncbi:cation:proton antiporter [Erythrobacter donghaensis]|uniref:cation:proton antiporter n=1 Tax=Erythrobacter donghaensis TaxID=267135 RepID=UPI000A3903D8|nr:cation:proton antiporter [Erythrobacter donghaensis]